MSLFFFFFFFFFFFDPKRTLIAGTCLNRCREVLLTCTHNLCHKQIYKNKNIQVDTSVVVLFVLCLGV